MDRGTISRSNQNKGSAQAERRSLHGQHEKTAGNAPEERGIKGKERCKLHHIESQGRIPSCSRVAREPAVVLRPSDLKGLVCASVHMQS